MASNRESQLRVSDGDSFTLNGAKIRLFGIDAPEGDQRCQRAGQDWDCGLWAKQVLEQALRAGEIRCETQDIDRYARLVSICYVGKKDIGAVMVAQGAATAYRAYSDRYIAAETKAKAQALGIWAGDMTPPALHRKNKAKPQPAQEAPASDCVIKGNISRAGKIYHMPGQRDYDATRIATTKGEAWFCSEEDARDAGFRPAMR